LPRNYVHLSVGNFNVDITLFVPKLPSFDESAVATDMIMSPGGAATNYAVAATCYGHEAVLVALASNDPIVDKMLDVVRSRGVNTNYVKRVEGAPGLVFVAVTESGERVMYKYRGVNEQLTPDHVPDEVIAQASVVHLASIPPKIAGKVAERASRHGVLVSYDPGVYAVSEKPHILSILNKIDILFLNRVEAKSLAGSQVSSLLRYGISLLVVKRGAGGAYVVQHGDLYYIGRVKPVGKPVNTTGAGDAFDAFFNAAYLEYRDLGKALAHALTAGTVKTTCKTSIMECKSELLKKQLENTFVEVVKEPDEWMLED